MIHVQDCPSFLQLLAILAKAAEDANFYSFTVSDHFFGNPESVAKHAHDEWTLLALLTPQTERIRLGTLVRLRIFIQYQISGELVEISRTQ